MQLQEFAGNARLKQQLSSLMASGRMPHAFLIEGEKGSGRHTLARLIAQWAVCSQKAEGAPCGVCPGCKKAELGCHPDIFMAEGTTPRSLHVDVIRQIRQEAYILPNEAETRVFLLFSAEAMTEQAQNALLKVLEEPPAHVIFVLTCESKEALLLTVRSRTQILSLEKPAEDEALSVLFKRLPKKSEDQLRTALMHTNGTIGGALAFLESKKSDKWGDMPANIALALLDGKEYPLLALSGRFLKEKDAFLHCLDELSLLFHQALCLSCGGGGTNEISKKLAMRLTGDRLMRLIQVTKETKSALLRNANMTLAATCFALSLREAAFSQQ